MHKENQTAQQTKAQELAQHCLEWAQTFNEWRPNEIIDQLNELEYGFLLSEMADHTTNRRNAIFNKNLVIRFLKTIAKYNDDAFSNLSNLKINMPCIETK